MRDDKVILEQQLRRQASWLKGSWAWLLDTRVLADRSPSAPRPSALDVGCGPGYVMELLASRFDVSGIDIDADMVRQANSRGSVVAQADAYDLPYEDESIDTVYCSFLMLWLDDPARAIGEMKRVAKDWVVCLAEPDYGGRIDHPSELLEVTRYLPVEIEELGGDPCVGRKLRSFFANNGMEGEIGVHQGVWDLGTLRRESEEEWANIVRAAEPRADPAILSGAEAVWEGALEAGNLFQFNPIFYAMGKKSSRKSSR